MLLVSAHTSRIHSAPSVDEPVIPVVRDARIRRLIRARGGFASVLTPHELVYAVFSEKFVCKCMLFTLKLHMSLLMSKSCAEPFNVLPTKALNERAVRVIRRVHNKLTGREFDDELTVAQQVRVYSTVSR